MSRVLLAAWTLATGCGRVGFVEYSARDGDAAVRDGAAGDSEDGGGGGDGGGGAVMFTRVTYVKASNTGAGDQFGHSIAISADGTRFAVGAPTEASSATGIDGNQADNSLADAGAVYVFVRSGGTWIQEAYVKASNTGQGDQFGWSVALSADGSTLAVGARHEDGAGIGVGANQASNAAMSAGAAYVFVRTGSTWTQQEYFKASNTNLQDSFGDSVGLSDNGDVLVVGASEEASAGPPADNSVPVAGAAYVYRRTGTVWAFEAYLKSPAPDTNDLFGQRVAISGDGLTIAIAADGEDGGTRMIDGNPADNSRGGSGAAFVFVDTGGGTWLRQAYLKTSNGDTGDGLGATVSLSRDGSLLLASALDEGSSARGVDGDMTNNSANRSGAAYLFERNGVTWTQRTYFKASNTDPNDQFGYGAAIGRDGDAIAICGIGESSATGGLAGVEVDNSLPSAGAAYIFGRAGPTWTQRAFAKSSNPGNADQFGWFTAISADGSVVVASTGFEDSATIGIDGDGSNNMAASSGAAYVFH